LNYNLNKLNFKETADSCCEFLRPSVGPAFIIKLYSLLSELVEDHTKEFNLNVTINENIVILESKAENSVDLDAVTKIIENNTADTLKEKFKELCTNDTLDISESIYLSNITAARLIVKLNAKIQERKIIIDIPKY
jgi:c-di-GMP-related signal transduction protein